MRIIAGAFRGTRLTALGKGDPSAHLRPTPDRVRESLFSVLQAHVDWEDCRVLDLFAGTGALGLEALSRGAKTTTFVEVGRAGGRLISANVDRLNLADQTEILRVDATRLGAAPHAHEVVFLDPPYGKNLGARALRRALENGWISPDGIVVWEENAPQNAPDGFSLIEHRHYGDTHITLLQTNAVPSAT